MKEKKGLMPAVCSSQHCCIQCLCPKAGHCRPTPPPETPRQSQASLAQSLGRSLFLSPGSWCTPGFVVPSKSLSPQPRGSVIKSHWPSNSLGILTPSADPKVGKSVVDPRTFATVQEVLWYSCSPVCGPTAQWVYGGANGDLL